MAVKLGVFSEVRRNLQGCKMRKGNRITLFPPLLLPFNNKAEAAWLRILFLAWLILHVFLICLSKNCGAAPGGAFLAPDAAPR
jgi:hypothetical protein